MQASAEIRITLSDAVEQSTWVEAELGLPCFCIPVDGGMMNTVEGLHL